MAVASNGKKIKSWQNVLVRNKKTDCWELCTFLYKSGKKYACIGYALVEEFVVYEEYYKECIPYKGNKELYGTSESWKTNSSLYLNKAFDAMCDQVAYDLKQ